MTSWQATTFLLGEYFNETDANPVFTVADGLIWVRQSVQRNSMVRKMEILKMRGQPTLPGLHTYRIGADGINVFAPAAAVVPVPINASRRASGRARARAATAAVAAVFHTLSCLLLITPSICPVSPLKTVSHMSTLPGVYCTA